MRDSRGLDMSLFFGAGKGRGVVDFFFSIV